MAFKVWGRYCYKCGESYYHGQDACHWCENERHEKKKKKEKQCYYAVRVGWTPGVYGSWAETRPALLRDADSALRGENFVTFGHTRIRPAWEKCSSLRKAWAFMGTKGTGAARVLNGKLVCQAWDEFRAGDLDRAEDTFAAGGDIRGHGAWRIALARDAQQQQHAQQQQSRVILDSDDPGSPDTLAHSEQLVAQPEPTQAQQQPAQQQVQQLEDARQHAQQQLDQQRRAQQRVEDKVAQLEKSREQADETIAKLQQELLATRGRTRARHAASRSAQEGTASFLASVDTAQQPPARKMCAHGRPISAAASAVVGKHRAGHTSRRKQARLERALLQREKESLAAKETAIAALWQAAEEKADAAGVSEIERARIATAQISDPVAQQQHKRYVAAVTDMAQQLASVEPESARVHRHLRGIASGGVSQIKKVARDEKQRLRQQQRQTGARVETAEQREQWRNQHLPHAKPQKRRSKLAAQHVVAKRKTQYGRRQQQQKRQRRREEAVRRRR
eukprot:SAG31_NODE_4262_length_3402_cov_12.222222_2_plen_506_part_00